jgi:hypothetical protein
MVHSGVRRGLHAGIGLRFPAGSVALWTGGRRLVAGGAATLVGGREIGLMPASFE